MKLNEKIRKERQPLSLKIMNDNAKESIKEAVDSEVKT